MAQKWGNKAASLIGSASIEKSYTGGPEPKKKKGGGSCFADLFYLSFFRTGLRKRKVATSYIILLLFLHTKESL